MGLLRRADTQVGKLMDTLDQKDLWKDTIVIFYADHGYHLGEHGWWLKFTVIELCGRVHPNQTRRDYGSQRSYRSMALYRMG